MKRVKFLTKDGVEIHGLSSYDDCSLFVQERSDWLQTAVQRGLASRGSVHGVHGLPSYDDCSVHGVHGLYAEAGDKSAPAVLLLHMMPAVKESWGEFQEKLQKAGFQSLAIDLRGHGESAWKNGGQIDYKYFTDTQQQEKIYDVEAAIDFLKEQGIGSEKIALAGASIGANLALQYQAEHSEIKASVLLSPGLDYRGLKTEPLALRIKEYQSVFLAGATKDNRSSGQSCADMAATLFDILKSKNKKLKIIEGKEHGTDMFGVDSGMIEEIIEWLKNI